MIALTHIIAYFIAPVVIGAVLALAWESRK